MLFGKHINLIIGAGRRVITYSAVEHTFAMHMQIYAKRKFAKIQLAPAPHHSETGPLSINYLNFIVLHYYLYQQQQRNEDNNFIPGKDSNVPIKQTPETRTNCKDERCESENLKPLICFSMNDDDDSTYA